MSAVSCTCRRYVALVAVVGCALAPLRAVSQVTDTRELQTYLTAITSGNAAQRSTELRRFLDAWPHSSLRRDALTWLAWDSHLSDRKAAAGWAGELLKLQPADPFATAIEMDAQQESTDEKSYERAQSAIKQLSDMRAPAGMGAVEFYRVRQFATAALCATVGAIELEGKDYESAREYLRRATALEPRDARYAYSLGLADLSGKKPDPAEGYLYLARAVNLAQGSPAAQQISTYARSRYESEGGKPGDWDRFLAAAVVPGTRSPGTTSTVEAAAARSVTRAPAAVSRGIAEAPPAAATAGIATATPPKVLAPKPPKISDLPPPKTDESELADLGWPGPDAAHRQPFRPGAPVSLGILIEASLVNGYKSEIVNSLADMVRRLAQNEQNEAFVLSFDKNISFRQDLTGDTRALEHALEKIKPNPGTALLDAVTIAAFQLNRVSRAGNNRVLLVISDGRNGDSKMPPLMATSQLESGAVRVYCIGVGALDSGGERLLQALASRTGGEARFTDSSGIRGAAHEMASKFGVDFPY